jgi:hypothetical protein
MKKKRTLPKFGAGGEKFKKDLAEYAGNTGAGILDIAATTIGMPSVADSLYTGTSANQFQNVAGGIGQVSAAAAPIVANTFLPGSGTAITAGQKGLGMVDGAIAKNNQAIDPQTGKPYTGTGDMIGKSVGGLGASVAPMMLRNGGIMKYGNGGKSSNLTDPVKLNQDPTQIPKGINPGGYNAFQTFLAKKGFVNDPSMNTDEGRAKYTNTLIEEFNNSDYVKKFPKNAITPDAIKAVQSYHKLSDPNIVVDGWVGSQTSQLRYPTPQLQYQAVSTDKKDPNYMVPANMSDSIQVLYGNKNYLLPASKYKDYKRSDFIDPTTKKAAFDTESFANGGKVLPEAGITSNQHVYENYKTKTNGMMVYNNGGTQSNIVQVDGPSHENGGILVNSPNGQYEVEKQEVIQNQPTQDRILSDKLRFPGSKKSIAAEFKPFEALSKIVSNKKLPEEVRKSAEIRQAQIFDNFYKVQDQVKGDKIAKYAKRLGVNINDIVTARYGGLKKYPGGGTYVGPMDEGIEMPAKYDQRGGGDPTEYLNKPIFNEGSVWEDVYNKGLADNSKTPAITDSADLSKGFNWGAIGTQLGLGIANNIGNFYDLKRANEVENTTYNRVTPQKVDPTAALRYNDAQSRAFNEALRNSSVGNSSTYIQNRKDAGIQQMYANDQIRQQYANTNAQIQNQSNYYNAGIGDKETETNMMNRATSRNIKSNAYANIGQNIMGQTKDYKMGQRDQDMLKMYGKMYEGNQYNPAYIQYLQSKGIS